ncbi:helicase HerA domain-containing protein [Deinococcus sp. ME38]|uniref:helicase HerA domain-containing protein n=1 Tax=Deinococcus sp. ME38 TaxID=3400344 RepID=UPI003B5918D9
MQDYEKLGAFYLGRAVDPATNQPTDELLLYDSADLTTHAVIIGMTGSGKTGLGLSLIEEALMDGVPVLAVDPKGDLGNLLLTFPDLAPGDFRPWVDEAEAARTGVSADDLAAQKAALWRKGLGEWGQSGERIRTLREKADFAVYTPGGSAGLPVSVLKGFDAPPPEIMDDADALRERIQGTVTGLLGLLGLDADPLRSREHVLLSNLLGQAWGEGRSLDMGGLIAGIQAPPFAQIGVMPVDAFYPPKERFELAMSLNNLLASPGFAAWTQGEPLDVGRFLFTPEGRPRVSVMSVAHLNDSERMFFVSMLLNATLAWMRTQSGTSSLRAVLYMDEIAGYFPPNGNPPSKPPMLTLLKQARAFGLGVVLSTQNPVDLDYKGLSNTGTWMIGRLQTDNDKARVLEALQGATAGPNALTRDQLDALLSGLGKRVFLMHNVHEARPTLFTTRWTMSYLAGPITGTQIRRLMGERKADGRGQMADGGRPDSGFAFGHRPSAIRPGKTRGSARRHRGLRPHVPAGRAVPRAVAGGHAGAVRLGEVPRGRGGRAAAGGGRDGRPHSRHLGRGDRPAHRPERPGAVGRGRRDLLGRAGGAAERQEPRALGEGSGEVRGGQPPPDAVAGAGQRPDQRAGRGRGGLPGAGQSGRAGGTGRRRAETPREVRPESRGPSGPTGPRAGEGAAAAGAGAAGRVAGRHERRGGRAGRAVRWGA